MEWIECLALKTVSPTMFRVKNRRAEPKIVPIRKKRIHFIATLARLLGPGGARSIVAESLLLKHQLLILNRSRHRSPNLCASDRIFAGLMGLLVRPIRLLRSVIPST